jgi:hypothetical protein
MHVIGNIKHATLKVSPQQNQITKKTYRGRGGKASPHSEGAPIHSARTVESIYKLTNYNKEKIHRLSQL